MITRTAWHRFTGIVFFCSLSFGLNIAQSFPAGQVTHRVLSKRLAEPSAPPVGNFSTTMKQIATGELSAKIAATCDLDDQHDIQKVSDAKSTTAIAVASQMVSLDNLKPAPDATALCAVRHVADAITSQMTPDEVTQQMKAAGSAVSQEFSGQSETLNEASTLLKSLASAVPAGSCFSVGGADGKNLQYEYQKWFPLWHSGCHGDDQIENYFAQNSFIAAGNAAQYQYNAQQSVSTINADLLTSTFQPGIQAILAGSATAGTSAGNNSTNTSGTSSTDSVATAIAKLQNGGDFNLRFPLPLLWTSSRSGSASLAGQITPNIGFTINGLSSQNTVTNSTQYAFNIPVEFYGQLLSTSHSESTAVLFFDLKPAGEFISKTLAAKLGPSVPTAMFLGQAALGIEFAQKVRFSLQYIYGNPRIYAADAQAANTNTPATTHISGFHFVVSFATQKKASSN